MAGWRDYAEREKPFPERALSNPKPKGNGALHTTYITVREVSHHLHTPYASPIYGYASRT